MNWTTLASRDLLELMRPKEGGKIINPTVVPPNRTPAPDFEAMKRLLNSGRDSRSENDERRSGGEHSGAGA